MTPSDFTQLVAEVASLKATVRARDLEIRDLKKTITTISSDLTDAMKELAKAQQELTLKVQPMLESAKKLDELLTKADQFDGMQTLASKLVGGGILTAVGAALAGIYGYFKGVFG